MQVKKSKGKSASASSQKFSICTAEARSVKPLLQQIIARKANWVESLSFTNCKVRWVPHSCEEKDQLTILQDPGKMIINKFPGLHGLARKDTFSSLMTLRNLLVSEQHNEVIESFEPKSFRLPQESQLFAQYQQIHRNATFIAKPKCGSEGNNCLLFKNLNDIPGVMANDMIVQRYIPDPLTLNGLKFDLRIYIVVVDLEQPQAYLCSEGMARFCTEEYTAPAPENF